MSVLSVIAAIADQAIALDAAAVEAVVDLPQVVPIPLAPPHVVGLAAIRSQVVTVVDPAVALGGEPQQPAGRALLVSIAGHRYAVRVASVSDVIALPENDEAAMLTPSWAAVASGRVAVGDDFALRVDPGRLIAPAQAAD